MSNTFFHFFYSLKGAFLVKEDLYRIPGAGGGFSIFKKYYRAEGVFSPFPPGVSTFVGLFFFIIFIIIGGR